jgi:hypothetical protein
MAREVNLDFERELTDLIIKRRKLCKDSTIKGIIHNFFKNKFKKNEKS